MTRKSFPLLTLLTLGMGVLLWGCNASLEMDATQEVSTVATEAMDVAAEATDVPTDATALVTPELTDATARVETLVTPPTASAPMGNRAPGGPGRPGGFGHGPDHGPGQPGCRRGGPPQGWSPDNPWRPFHRMPVPQAYAALTNPIPADETSLARGEELYQVYCASCHGETGWGDGPAASTMTPPPTPLALTALRMSDGYLYWRIMEGGTSLGTAMPSYKNVIADEDIWHIINFLRSLGGDTRMQQRLLQALTRAVQEGLITQEEADLFLQVHDLIEAYRQEHGDGLRALRVPGNMLGGILQGLVASGQLDQVEAQRFQDIFRRLHVARLIPPP